MEMLQGVWKQHLSSRAVVGYGVKIVLPSPPNYVTRWNGNLTSFISWNKRSGMVMVVMLCLTAVCNACLKPTMTGFLVLMLVDFTLSSATR